MHNVFYLAIRDMATGNVPIFLPAIKNSLVLFCLAPKLRIYLQVINEVENERGESLIPSIVDSNDC